MWGLTPGPQVKHPLWIEQWPMELSQSLIIDGQWLGWGKWCLPCFWEDKQRKRLCVTGKDPDIPGCNWVNNGGPVRPGTPWRRRVLLIIMRAGVARPLLWAGGHSALCITGIISFYPHRKPVRSFCIPPLEVGEIAAQKSEEIFLRFSAGRV